MDRPSRADVSSWVIRGYRFDSDAILKKCAMTGAALNVVSFLFLGFLLGMRHATDADHVVAIATMSVGSAVWRARR